MSIRTRSLSSRLVKFVVRRPPVRPASVYVRAVDKGQQLDFLQENAVRKKVNTALDCECFDCSREVEFAILKSAADCVQGERLDGLLTVSEE